MEETKKKEQASEAVQLLDKLRLTCGQIPPVDIRVTGKAPFVRVRQYVCNPRLMSATQ